MKRINEYAEQELIIDDLKTYIIPEQNYEAFISDSEMMRVLGFNQRSVDHMKHMMKTNGDIGNIKVHFAVVYHSNRCKFQWEPVHVAESEGAFYHVFIRKSWMCKDCGHFHEGIIVMPMSEGDPTFLSGPNRFTYSIPDIFKKIPCECCGHQLNCHLMIINK